MFSWFKVQFFEVLFIVVEIELYHITKSSSLGYVRV